MSETKFTPETEKLCSAETEPLQEVKAVNDPDLEITGTRIVPIP